ncbi:MAG: hypothetical protein V8Q43_01610 [Christensenellaceae bacterium]
MAATGLVRQDGRLRHSSFMKATWNDANVYGVYRCKPDGNNNLTEVE